MLDPPSRKIEDLQELQELRSAVEIDSGRRFTMDEIYREFGRLDLRCNWAAVWVG
ncbi:hypothetical protein HMPREF0291_11977 [Corynebacterium genitalium ATCC 33030]|uniref:Uncharacterized protein n=1 Tax=Corynebacterium genitalium ATCC 33030 TaxID=585529 RepID=D7WDT9_9CORY|nr:hypothetical protein HMPREF0291_11977 [Corynebacterium genitalium ATCC 33030]